MIGRSVASAMRLKCAIAICRRLPQRERRRREHQQGGCAALRRHAGDARRLEAAVGPDAVDDRQPSPISSCAISSTRRCSSKVQEATSVECALTVMAEMPARRRHVAQVLAEARLVDRKVVMERQEDGGDDAVRDVGLVTRHRSSLLQANPCRASTAIHRSPARRARICRRGQPRPRPGPRQRARHPPAARTRPQARPQ